ncbi:MAG TPA: HIT domain-containing protein [Acidimicrobiales bacterium]|jgi:UDPglucose--hexose-1-phosphate uridylyltransferase
MSELRLNPLAGRWVTVSAERALRPLAFDPRQLPVESEPRTCPFCPGNEEASLPALETYGPAGQWLVRIVPNRYPAFSGHDPLHVEHLGPVWTQARASGIHEVLVLSPDHDASWADLDDRQAGLVMAAMRDRFEDHASLSGIRYTQAIVNHGREAGASLVHPHGQLLGMPFVPRDLSEEEAGFARFEGGCLLCTTLEAEVEAGHRTVLEDDHTVVVCPFWSGGPFELLVIPRAHESHLQDAKPGDVVGVGRAIASILRRVRDLLGDVAYNVVFHSSPHQHDGEYHWHVHILPKLATRAGFELGTGVLLNIVPPEQAAFELNSHGS